MRSLYETYNAETTTSEIGRRRHITRKGRLMHSIARTNFGRG